MMRSVLHCVLPWLSKWPGEEELCFPSLNFCLNINVAKEPYYGPLKLKRSQNFILYYVYCWFVSYWTPPATMDAVLAPIVAGKEA